MKFFISEDSIKHLNLPIGDLLLLTAIYFESPISNPTIKKLFAEGYLEYAGFDCNGEVQGIKLTEEGIKKVETMFLNSEFNICEKDKFETLAEKLMEVFPKGKQPGGKYYYRGNAKDVALKLKKFFKKYGDTYTDEQIINAAKRYVTSFNGNYTYMRLLKYFIWKSVAKIDEEGKSYIEEVSELADYITNENSDTVMHNNQDWTANLV